MLRRLVDVEPGEVGAMLLGCLYFFFTLASYFVLRPIRDELAVAAGARTLPYLFTGTLAAMLVASPIFSALVVRFPAKRFIGITYQFFAANLVLFFLAPRLGIDAAVAGRTFFVWTSVFNLFVVSVFWSFMADTFRSDQAKRLFGFIAVGGTLGSITGSALTAFLARSLGTPNLLLISAALLEGAAFLVAIFPAASADGRVPRAADERARRAIGGSVWAGITHVTRSRYLLGISGFLFLYTVGATILYFAQTEIVGAHLTSREARTAMLARMELATQTLTAIIQILLTGRVIRAVGLPAALAIMPAVSVLGFAALGAGGLSVLSTFVVFSVVRRATNFGLTNPSMEVLFTVVSREDKYKAKTFIETFVYRAGDQLAAWGYAGLAALGFGLAAIAWLAVPLSAIFMALGVWLGREQGGRAREAPVPATRSA
ncbi:MAG TPA: MFS transporter [Methylomirabilota bacterium]|jgi:AAA family ATP:ADP antiporter